MSVELEMHGLCASISGLGEGMTMKAVSPDTDFSFDFQDLDFRKFDPQT